MSEEHPVLKPKKRNSADAESVADTPAPRSKRGKYTSVACDDCKKKKLKCIPSEDNTCERCIAGGLTCTFATSTQATKEKPDDTHRGEMPKQPQFVGPTRSAFGILVSERSLNRMGVPKFDSMPPSGAQSPIEPVLDSINDLSFWHCCTASDITKYLVNFQEEVESVYPFIDIAEYIAQSKEILQAIRGGGLGFEDEGKVAISTGILLEEPSKLELATAIVDSVQTNVSSILSPQVDLKEVQLLAMLSIYYFHAGEELLAWRSIGIAARQALEMGLHRKRSLLDNFKDTDSRRLATRVFWCVYVLDRRWSFGTSLSFALVDKDVDPELPKPDEEYLYLQCMVGYGQLCSKIWEAIPPFGSASQTIPDDTAAILDLKTQDWLDSIPPHLRLRHPRLGLAPRAQPRLPHRLRALLYLRGNYARILIYRHHLMSTASIAANPQNAWLVVDIAQDTIQVLVHLHATTDIYKRQQNVFNYFLLSALAVIFLAVCHAPDIFSVPCKRTFSDGVELVRGLSRHNIVSKRLWKSIRGMIPRMNTFGFPQNGEEGEARKDDENGHNGPTNEQNAPQVEANAAEQVPMAMPENESFSFGDMMFGDADVANSVPDMFQMSESLLNLFNAFGEGQQFLHPVPNSKA
ncbi:Zn(2)-C6 fungal-type DNA-binding domain [Fusarium oxysporum f. sp. vasinfectum]|nr:Zn(2)-C6 fungal-type DNA-binding domain [Fusarium oxysporum f. sp. vasinfectum]WKT40428.1 Zn(2)-C6 fungal-type DNA-binding domain [Fusarium oxysporum f. sp. vasinfectum]